MKNHQDDLTFVEIALLIVCLTVLVCYILYAI